MTTLFITKRERLDKRFFVESDPFSDSLSSIDLIIQPESDFIPEEIALRELSEMYILVSNLVNLEKLSDLELQEKFERWSVLLNALDSAIFEDRFNIMQENGMSLFYEIHEPGVIISNWLKSKEKIVTDSSAILVESEIIT